MQTASTGRAYEISEILSARRDLSSLLIHFTRKSEARSASDNLETILSTLTIEAKTPMGIALRHISDPRDIESQKCVCFTEVPLEHAHLMTRYINGRSCQFEPYGIGIERRQAQTAGVTPVWYVDISPGHNWLTKPLERLIKSAVASESAFEHSDIAKIAPFVDTMGGGKNPETGQSYGKNFWWEREWRHIGNYTLPSRIVVIAPESEFDRFRRLLPNTHEFDLIDVSWNDQTMRTRSTLATDLASPRL